VIDLALWWVILLIALSVFMFFVLILVILLIIVKRANTRSKNSLQTKIQTRIARDREKVKQRMDRDRERLGLTKKKEQPITLTSKSPKEKLFIDQTNNQETISKTKMSLYLKEEDKIQKIKEILIEFRMNVPVQISRIVQLSNLPEKEVIDYIKRLITNGVIIGDFLELENVFIKTSQFKPKSEITCFFCGNPITALNSKCTKCQREVIKCSVCKLPISFGEEVGKCSLCEASAHLNHLQEWVKTQGKCPYCLQELPEEGIFIENRDEMKK